MNFDDILPFSDIKSLKFTTRPRPFDVNLRPAQRIAFLVLSLYLCGHKGKASVLKLQLLNWALSTPSNGGALQSVLTNGQGNSKIVHLDSALNIVVRLCHGYGLIVFEKDRAQLTSKGDMFARLIISNELFPAELKFLHEIGNRLPESRAGEIMGRLV